MSTSPRPETEYYSQTDTDGPATHQQKVGSDTPGIDVAENARASASEVEHTFVRNPDASTQRKTVIECDGSCGIPDCDEMRVVPETW